jgi:hypothetical protein
MRQRRGREAPESPVDSPLSAPASVYGGRNIRRRVDFDSPALDGRVLISTELLQMFEFHVYLPNRTSVEVRVTGEQCAYLTVPAFVRLVQDAMSRSADTGAQKQREIVWGDHVRVEDFYGNRIEDRQFALKHESNAIPRVLLLYVSSISLS